MAKTFKTWEEAKSFSYPNKSKSLYYSVIFFNDESPLPKNTKEWKVCQAIHQNCEISIEVTPLWVTIVFHKNGKAKKCDIARKGRDVNAILNEAFKGAKRLRSIPSQPKKNKKITA